MANTIRYGKPRMTNLPSELGVRIFKQILSTPAPDRAKMKAESKKLLDEMVKARDMEDAKQSNSGE